MIEREVLVRELEALPGGSRLVRPALPKAVDGQDGFSAAPEASLVPAAPGDDADTMVAHLVRACPISDAEALRVLRAAFPHAPLSHRVTACARWKTAA